MLDAGGGAQSSSITRVQCAWGKFRNLLPLLTSKAVPSKVKGELFRACVQTVMLYGSETWPVKVEDTQRLHRNGMLISAGYVVPLYWTGTHVTYSGRGSVSLQSVS